VKFPLAENLISKRLREASEVLVRKRAGTSKDSYAWSYETPELVWDFSGVPFFDDFQVAYFNPTQTSDGETALSLLFGTSGADYSRQVTNRPHAESIVGTLVGALKSAIASSEITAEKDASKMVKSVLNRNGWVVS